MANVFPGASLQLGSEGDSVKQVQARLNVQQTGVFGPTTQNTVKAFQTAHGLKDDGIVGPITWNAIFAAPVLDGTAFPGPELRQGSQGDAVKQIQQRLGISQTGVFDTATELAVTAFQGGAGLAQDGTVGPQTWAKLFTKNPERADMGGVALQIARKFVGVSEQPAGSNRGPMVDKFLARVGVPPGNPWCLAFAYYCVDEAANELHIANPLKKTGSCSQFFKWAQETNRLVTRPSPGDLFLVIGGETGHLHTGFVAGPVSC